LGQIIDETQKRDAIHIAVLPIVATEKLFAGQDVGLVDGGASTKAKKHTGIVDPFLKVPVMPGQRFWLLLYPRMVTSLRHVWSHPEFVDETTAPAAEQRGAMAISRAFIEACADSAGLEFDELLQGARDYVSGGEYLCEGGRWEGFSIPDEFWNHYEVVTSEVVPEDQRGNFFSCSC
jgi:hypothetical protein